MFFFSNTQREYIFIQTHTNMEEKRYYRVIICLVGHILKGKVTNDTEHIIFIKT